MLSIIDYFESLYSKSQGVRQLRTLPFVLQGNAAAELGCGGKF